MMESPFSLADSEGVPDAKKGLGFRMSFNLQTKRITPLHTLNPKPKL